MLFYEATDVGRVRSTNEDCGAVLDENTCIVADGMGGHAAGEVASRVLVEEVRKCLAGVPVEEVNEESLKDALHKGNHVILEMAKEHSEYEGMGTTATILHSTTDRAVWAHVGDSRIYLYRRGAFKQMTKDHSYVESLVERGTITQEEARRHPRKNVLLRAVGVEENIDVDTGSFDLQQGDKLLLCTDGLTNMLSDREIAEILLEKEGDPARKLMERALAAGGTDNVTAIVAVYDG